jgi:glycosyltransferase involved in cell wall biosynthesis
MKFAVIGSRGYPSTYGGFETLVRHLAPFLAEQGHDVTVYGRREAAQPVARDARVRSVQTRGVDKKSLSTLTHGATSVIHARREGYDSALVLNPANGFFLPVLKRAGVPTAVNVDGLEWLRAKWNKLGKRTFVEGAKLCVKHADELVFDSEALRPHWLDMFGVQRGTFIPYGADITPAPSTAQIDALGLEAGKYVLVVSRFIPENNLDLLLSAVELLESDRKIVIVGSGRPGEPMVQRVEAFAAQHPNVMLLGHVADQSLLEALWSHCGAYWHGHSVGGTNPALLQAMAAGAPTIALRTTFNREVLQAENQLVESSPTALAQKLLTLLGSAARREELRVVQRARIESSYTWDMVCRHYEQLLVGLAGGTTVVDVRRPEREHERSYMPVPSLPDVTPVG